MNAKDYYLELTGEDTPEAPAAEQILDVVATDSEPKETPVQAFPESTKAWGWFEALTIPEPANDEDTPKVTAEFYKYSITVYRSLKYGWNIYTKSPQQKQHRHNFGTSCVWHAENKEACREGFARFLAEREAVAQRQAERTAAKRTARASFVNPYTVGDILVGSWGYDQTNVDFFQVLQVRPVALKIRKIAARQVKATGFDSADVSAVKDSFVRPESHWVTIQIDESGRHDIPSPEYGSLGKWDGKPHYCSWGH